MPCRPLGNGWGYACGRGANRHPCSAPGCRKPHTKLCDYPVKTASGTCDKPLCSQHAVSMAREVDYCPPHAAIATKATVESK